MNRRHLQRVLAVTVGLLAVLGPATPANAHEGTGIVTVETAMETPTGMEFTIRLTWENDGHPAADATVTATAIDPSGEPTTPSPMTPIDDDGRYRAVLALPTPGTWTVRFSTISPTATLEVPQLITAAEPAPTTTKPERDPALDDHPIATTPDLSENPDDGGGNAATTVIGGGLLIGIIGAAIVGFRRSTKRLH